MSRLLLPATLLLSLLSCCTGSPDQRPSASQVQQAAQLPPATIAPPRGTTQPLPSADKLASGYLALPQGGGKHPALIVIQEWWGLNPWIKQNSDRFADHGYVTLAVDLYRGRKTTDPEEAHELMRGLPEDRAMNDLHAAFEYLTSRPDVDGSRIGVIGWCMGGGYALMFAIDEPKVRATAINYGHLMTDPKNLQKINSPLLGNFGAEDRGIPPSDVEAFRQQLLKLGKSIDLKVYKGAGHGFMNPDNRTGFVAAASADAWKRIDSFLAAELRP